MKHILSLLFLVFITAGTFAQRHPKIITDPKNQKPMIVGKCSRTALEKEPFREWFDKEYAEYKVDTKTLDLLKNQWKDIRIVLVMGTWCSDSKREVPRFYKILDYVKFKKKHLTLICRDREKNAGNVDIIPYKINFVPTIIIYRGKAEIGRIVENPAESLEKDLAKLISRAE